jgi:hypothetical protein
MANNRFNWTRVQAQNVPSPRMSSLITSRVNVDVRMICDLEFDHTTSTGLGYFMQADLGKRQATDYARLKSPLLATAQCLTFYYHILGFGGTLNLHMAIGDNLGIPIWTRAGSQGDVWRFGRIAITKANANLVFEGNSRVYVNIAYLLVFLSFT